MKTVFVVKAVEKGKELIPQRLEFTVFAEDMSLAIKKVSDCLSDNMEIREAELLCVVEEDKDLEEYKEE